MSRCRSTAPDGVGGGALEGLTPAAALAATASFDDLSTAPGLAGSKRRFFANGNRSLYAGVTWESGFAVAGDAYRVDVGNLGDPGDALAFRDPRPKGLKTLAQVAKSLVPAIDQLMETA